MVKVLSITGYLPRAVTMGTALEQTRGKQDRTSSRKEDLLQGLNTVQLSPPVHPHLLTEDTGGVDAPLSRTEAEAIGSSFEVSLGSLVSYICIYIYANYMCLRSIANGR